LEIPNFEFRIQNFFSLDPPIQRTYYQQVSISIRHIQSMVEVWARKDEPQTADLQQALHTAKVLENDTSSATHLRAFAWHLVVETHNSVGWELPADVNLASCHAAAASLSHSASLLTNQIAEQVQGITGPVLLLGAFGASRSVFGRWDLLPASGALLVSFDIEEGGRPDGADLPEIHGIRWAAPGRLREVYEKHASPASLDGVTALVPHPELVAARSAFRPLQPEDPETLLFCGAALASAANGRWTEVNRIARALGHPYAPLEFAASLGIDQRLGLEVGRVRRSTLALRRLFRR
jgi:hypothetical protein